MGGGGGVWFSLLNDFNIDSVTTQHTPKCVENCSDRKVSNNFLSNFYQIFRNLCYNSDNDNEIFLFNIIIDYRN